MEPCPHPHCSRDYPHDHPPASPETALSSPQSDETPEPSRHPPENGSGAPSAPRSRDCGTTPENERTPRAEATGGASPEVGRRSPDDSTDWPRLWSEAGAALEAAQAHAAETLKTAAAARAQVVREMRDCGDMTWNEIGEVTGLTRARLNQLYSSSSS